MSSPGQDGIPLRDHVSQLVKVKGYTPDEHKYPPFPPLMTDVWHWFIDLSNSRSTGMNGPEPITYTQIKHWKELTGSPATSRDIEAIRLLDRIYMRVYNG